MTTETAWKAKTKFKYGDVEYNRGDIVKPIGGKWDHKIFCDGSRFVVAALVEKTPARRRRKSGGNNAS